MLTRVFLTLSLVLAACVAAQSASTSQKILLVAQDLSDNALPTNSRLADLAASLQQSHADVSVLSRDSQPHADFTQQFANQGVRVLSNTDVASTLAAEQFDAAFLPLWFWSQSTVPETYQRVLSEVSPKTKVVVLTDDAHTARHEMIAQHIAASSRAQKLSAALPRFSNNAYAADLAAREAQTYSNADLVVTISEADASTLALPNAQVLHFASPSTVRVASNVASFESRNGVVFTGYGENPTNKLGLEYFFTEVYPLLSEDMKAVQFHLVGAAPRDNYASLRASGATIVAHGKVSDAELQSILNSGRVMIAPIPAATGVNTKVYLGLASGIPVVSTSVAAEGLRYAGMDAQLESALLLADSAADFAASLQRAYTDSATWSALSQNGLSFVSSQLSSGQFDADVTSIVSALSTKTSKAKSFSAKHLNTAQLAQFETQTRAHLMSGGSDSQTCVDAPCVHGTCADSGDSYICTCTGTSFTGTNCDIPVDDCPASNACNSHGTCADGINTYTCTCSTGYSGTFCDTNVNDCPATPCNSHGTCTDGLNTYTCTCTSGYTGTFCETNINDCPASNACNSHGTCNDGVNTYTCSCVTGYSGTFCETNVNDCPASNACSSHGTCNDGVNTYTCTCSTGYSGTFCETNANDCPASNACNGHGTCTDGLATYTCACSTGYSGTLCDTNANDCPASNACNNHGTCVDGLATYTCTCSTGYSGTLCDTNANDCPTSNICSGHGTCTDGLATYTCACTTGYSGANCETNANDCPASNACNSHGTCVDGLATYTCTCSTGYSGTFCDTNANDCPATNACNSHGTCVDGLATYTCTCSTGYSGTFCDTNANDCPANNACSGHGTCVDGLATYTCTCSTGYSGTLCATNANDCPTSNICSGHGTCTDGLATFTCACTTGWSGAICNTNANDCPLTNACNSHGTCTDGLATYTCLCQTGYSGTMCETNTNDCPASPCNGHGTCNDGVASYTCTCSTGWSGDRCATNANDCPTTNTCNGHGTCTDGLATYTCACTTGYSGINCEIDINECANNYCGANSAAGVDRVGYCQCDCLPGWTGARCNEDFNECASNPCEVGTCTNGANLFTCTCPTGYQGEDCSQVKCTATTAGGLSDEWCTDSCNRDIPFCPADSCTCTAGADVFHAAGCADGTREGFTSVTTYPNIAACSGAWTVAGLHINLALAPTCQRKAGNAAGTLSTGCSASDICQEGWHVCTGFNDVRNSAQRTQGCYDITDFASNSFFATRQSGNGNAFCNNDPEWGNDIFGCGTLGDPMSGWTNGAKESCPGLNVFSHNWCNKLNPSSTGWFCEDSTGGWSESYTITHSQKTTGGVMCCRDGLNSQGIPVDTSAIVAGPTCEAQTTVQSCAAGKVMHVLSADWGRADTGSCKSTTASRNTKTTCRHTGVLKKIFALCEGQASCSFAPSLTLFGGSDPCSDTTKYFWGKYECVNADCLPKKRINGNGNAWGLLKCKKRNRYLASGTDDKDCNNFFPEQTTQNLLTCEGANSNIYCPAGTLIKVMTMSYGRKDGVTCPHSEMWNQACAASGVQDKVKALCDGKQTCSFAATNDVFGDPCVGTYKYIKGTYQCYENPSNDWKTQVCHTDSDKNGKATGSKTQLAVGPADLQAHLDHPLDFIGQCTATVLITINLGYDYDSIKDINEFIATFLRDLYAAVGVDASVGIFFVQSVSRGSVVVDVEVRDSPYAADPAAPAAPDVVAADLEAQAADPDSKLYEGEYTQHTTSLKATSKSSGNSKDNSLAIGLGTAAGVVVVVTLSFIVFRMIRNKRMQGQRVHSEQTFSHGDQTEKNNVPPAKSAGDVESAAMPAGHAAELERLSGAVQADADAQKGEKVWVFNRDGQQKTA